MQTGYLLDTNAISEAVKSRRDSGYMEWLSSAADMQMHVSCLTMGEIQKGITLAKDAELRKRLSEYLSGLHEAFEGRILELDVNDCVLWGKLAAKAQNEGKVAPVIDSLLAAQCLNRQMTLVTRNIKDFGQFSGLEVLCPWSG
jgi:toxin FitB